MKVRVVLNVETDVPMWAGRVMDQDPAELRSKDIVDSVRAYVLDAVLAAPAIARAGATVEASR